MTTDLSLWLAQGHLFMKPDFQYDDRAGSTGHVPKAPVFGAQLGINF